jgi:3-oxoacyl-[acyl-carrier protein] reductase
MYALDNRIAVVTGGAQGIGEATAIRLASEGATVAIFDVNEKGQEVASRISESGGKALWFRTDVRLRNDIETSFSAVVDEFGIPSILVSNAGIVRDNFIHKMTDDDWDAVIDTHLKGGFMCAQVAQRLMIKAEQQGSFVFLSSRAMLGNPGQVNYASAKAGLIGLARTLSVELGRFGITVNVVVPGHMDTEMVRKAAERARVDYQEMCARTIERNAIKRVGQAEDIANAIAFLVSDQASYITGEVLHVTGRPPM